MKPEIHACECHKQWMPEAENYVTPAAQEIERQRKTRVWIKALGLVVVGLLLFALACWDGARTLNRWLGRPLHLLFAAVCFVRYRLGCLLRGDWREAFRLPNRFTRRRRNDYP